MINNHIYLNHIRDLTIIYPWPAFPLPARATSKTPLACPSKDCAVTSPLVSRLVGGKICRKPPWFSSKIAGKTRKLSHHPILGQKNGRFFLAVANNFNKT
jgi:hypothetical protein